MCNGTLAVDRCAERMKEGARTLITVPTAAVVLLLSGGNVLCASGSDALAFVRESCSAHKSGLA
jgi:hypothetical protein